MEYTVLGSTGVTVSRVCLGCMSFGSGRGWTLGEEESRELIDRAIDLGVNFFDTANVYSFGESESILGRALAEYDRDRFVVATKGYYQIDPDDPNSGGLSRRAVDTQIEGSLRRLGMETVDLYQTHRWDRATSVEEILRALDDVVRRGKTRYVGASSMWAHQFGEALHTSERLGVERFATMQNHYNLVYREEEREMLPLCRREGVGVIPWSPLAKGYLTRRTDDEAPTARSRTDEGLRKYPYREGGGPEVSERVAELAADRDVSMAQISLAWLLHQEAVDAPVVGTTSVEHLEEAVEAVEIDLSESDLSYLEEPYRPVRVAGHGNRPPDRHLAGR